MLSKLEPLSNDSTKLSHGWAKHAAAKRWCSILAIQNKSVLTRCRGRFSQADDHEIADRPPVEVRCVVCQQAYAAHELGQLTARDGDGHAGEVNGQVVASKSHVTVHDAISARKDYIDSADYVPGEDW
jgi:hypothetical protein